MATEAQEAKHGFTKKLERNINSLQGKGRGNLDTISDAVVSLCEAMMFIMQVDYVTTETLKNKQNVQWRIIIKDTVIALVSITTICYTILRITGG